MIPILYDSIEVNFTSNGLGRLADCLSCKVTEERNGIYECEFTYPITGEMYPLIQEGCIVGVIHDDVKDIQPFDIYGRSAPLNGVVTFYAHHISYRLGNIVLKPMTAASCAAALADIPNKTYTDCPFTFWTDKSVSAEWTVKTPDLVKAVLGGQQGSILDVYGKGEYEWDKWLVRLYANRGVDNGVSIRYGVNLTDLTHDVDASQMYTAVVPFWRSPEDDTVVSLDEGYVKVSMPQLVPWTNDDDEEIVDDQGQVIHFNAESSTTLLRTTVMDMSEAFKKQPTQAQLRAEALRRLTNSEAWLPSENITVSFVDLAHTEEYKNVAALQRVRLCDRVSVYCGPLGVSAVSMQVIRVVFNVLTERYDEIELGKAKTSFAQAITAQVEEATKDLPSVAMMQQAINNATDKITGAQGGHVRFVYDANGDPQEILIMDTEDIETAVNIWRWNSGGLGFSPHGYAGPYETAMTADGQIVADFITAGFMSANRISGGVIDGETLVAKLLNIVNGDMDVIASFDDVIRLGKAGSTHTEIDFNSFEILDETGGIIFSVGDMRDADGSATLVVKYTGDGETTQYTVYPVPSSTASDAITVTVDGMVETAWSFNYAIKDLIFTSAPADGANIVITYKTNYPVYHYDIGQRAANSGVGAHSVAEGIDVESSGVCSHAEGNGTKATMYYSHAEGENTEASGHGSHAEGFETIASGEYSHAEGRRTAAFSQNVHAEGYLSVASGGNSHAEGYSTESSGSHSHAEGINSVASNFASHAEGHSTASGYYGHAEGQETVASGYASHAEGSVTVASGYYSHAEGSETVASGFYSHAEGAGTLATARAQHAMGRYNIEDIMYAEIVGNGTSDNDRSNARTLDWFGNEWIAGTLTQASDSRLKEECGKLPDVSSIRARRFRWNDKKISHDDKDHIGYYAQDVEAVAPYLVDEDASGYKSLDYIALLCAKVDALERKVAELEKGGK